MLNLYIVSVIRLLSYVLFTTCTYVVLFVVISSAVVAFVGRQVGVGRGAVALRGSSVVLRWGAVALRWSTVFLGRFRGVVG